MPEILDLIELITKNQKWITKETKITCNNFAVIRFKSVNNMTNNVLDFCFFFLPTSCYIFFQFIYFIVH